MQTRQQGASQRADAQVQSNPRRDSGLATQPTPRTDTLNKLHHASEPTPLFKTVSPSPSPEEEEARGASTTPALQETPRAPWHVHNGAHDLLRSVSHDTSVHGRKDDSSGVSSAITEPANTERSSTAATSTGGNLGASSSNGECSAGGKPHEPFKRVPRLHFSPLLQAQHADQVCVSDMAPPILASHRSAHSAPGEKGQERGTPRSGVTSGAPHITGVDAQGRGRGGEDSFSRGVRRVGGGGWHGDAGEWSHAASSPLRGRSGTAGMPVGGVGEGLTLPRTCEGSVGDGGLMMSTEKVLATLCLESQFVAAGEASTLRPQSPIPKPSTFNLKSCVSRASSWPQVRPKP